jgi:hypothetical protein
MASASVSICANDHCCCNRGTPPFHSGGTWAERLSVKLQRYQAGGAPRSSPLSASTPDCMNTLDALSFYRVIFLPSSGGMLMRYLEGHCRTPRLLLPDLRDD